jgi:hypothetical protein
VPKLDRRPLSLTQQMSLLLLSPSTAFKVRVLQEGACGQHVQEHLAGRQPRGHGLHGSVRAQGRAVL